MSARLFKVSFRKMLDIIKLVNDLDRSIISSHQADKSEGWLQSCLVAQERIESRLQFIEFRILFELGYDLPMMSGESRAHAEVARDLFSKGAITEQRLESALRGDPSEDLPIVRATIEKIRAGQEPF